jgi:hypothetical protein
MRLWLFHPLIFYPLAAVLAVLVIAVSLRPQAWPQEPAPAAAQVQQNALIFAGEAFDAPEPSPDQNVRVTRDFWGKAQTLRIAVHADQPQPPTPADRGVRLLLTPQNAAALDGRPLTVEVSYDALPVNAAQALAVSVQGDGPVAWLIRPLPSQNATVRFDVPARTNPNAIGLRAINSGGNAAFGLEITRIRIIPHA